MYSTLASIIKFLQPSMGKYRKSHFWLAHPEDVIFKKKVLLQNTLGTIPVRLHYVKIGSKMQNFKPIHLVYSLSYGSLSSGYVFCVILTTFLALSPKPLIRSSLNWHSDSHS